MLATAARCWIDNPKDRADFREIVNLLEANVAPAPVSVAVAAARRAQERDTAAGGAQERDADKFKKLYDDAEADRK